MSNFRFTRPDSFPPIIKNIIILNILVWVAQLFYDRDWGLTMRIGLWPIDTPGFKPYQVATHMFAHSTYGLNGRIEFFHILFNMFSLYMFGRVLENVWGAKRFLFFYLACGVGAAAAHLGMQYFMGTYSITIGASGAVMGVMIAFAYLFPNTEFRSFMLPITIKAKWLALIWVVADLFGGFSNSSRDNTAHFAHLGGALTGFIIVWIWNKTNRRTLY